MSYRNARCVESPGQPLPHCGTCRKHVRMHVVLLPPHPPRCRRSNSNASTPAACWKDRMHATPRLWPPQKAVRRRYVNHKASMRQGITWDMWVLSPCRIRGSRHKGKRLIAVALLHPVCNPCMVTACCTTYTPSRSPTLRHSLLSSTLSVLYSPRSLSLPLRRYMMPIHLDRGAALGHGVGLRCGRHRLISHRKVRASFQ